MSGPQVVEMQVLSDWPRPGNLFTKARPTDFPLEVLPSVIGDYVADQAERMGADAGMLAMFGFAAIAAAITDAVQIQPKHNDPSWHESARVWIAPVGTPSIMKTPALKAMSLPLAEQDQRWRENEASALHAYRLEDRIYKKRESSYINAVANDQDADPPVPPEEPTIHRAIVQDITIEKLGEVLRRTNRGTLAHVDELSGLFGGMDAYRERGVSKDRANYLALYNGGSHRIDRVNRGSLLVPNWGLSIVGGIQPAPMRKIAKNMQDDGLLQRFNVILANDAGRDHDRPRSRDTFEAYRSAILDLFQVKAAAEPVLFDDDALAVWEAFSDFVHDAIGIGALPQQLRTHIGKWRGQFARYALMLHVLAMRGQRKHPNDARVSRETAKATQQLFMRYLLPHALAFYSDVLGHEETMEQARWLAGFILSHKLGQIDRRTIKRNYRVLRNASDWDIHQAMDTLEVFGWVRQAAGEVPPVHRWDINPDVHHAFEQKAAEERERRNREQRALAKIFQQSKPAK